MIATLMLAAALSLVIGAVLGLLGGGGAILTVPMLVYVVGLAPRSAITLSLLFVGVTSLVGTALHARAGHVRWKVGGLFGGAAMIGAFAGGRIARFVPAGVLLLAFTVVMIVTALAMLRPRDERVGSTTAIALGRLLALGVAVGAMSGFVGAGGGFLVVPALTLLGGLAMRDAVGTSLFVIALQSFAGFAAQATRSELDVRLVAVMLVAALVGMLAGSRASERLPAASLRSAFAWLVLAMGLFVIQRQLSWTWTAIAGVVSLVGAYMVVRRKHPAGTDREIARTRAPGRTLTYR